MFLSSLVRKLQSDDTLGDVSKLIRLANAAASSMQLSTSLANVDTMVSIALALKDIPLERVTFVQYPGHTGGDGIYAGKVRPDEAAAEAMLNYVRSDQPFQLTQAGDDEGSTLDPNAPAPTAPDLNATPNPTGDGRAAGRQLGTPGGGGRARADRGPAHLLGLEQLLADL